MAREFFVALNRADGKAVLALYANDAVCWTAGSLPFSGAHSVAEVAVIMEGILSAFPQGIQFTIKGMTAEDDRVAIEAESRGLHASGVMYENQYHFLMVIRDGRVREFKEYLDTQLAREVLVDLAPS